MKTKRSELVWVWVGVLGAMCLTFAVRADEIQLSYTGASYGAYQTGLSDDFTVFPAGPDLDGELSSTVGDDSLSVGTVYLTSVSLNGYSHSAAQIDGSVGNSGVRAMNLETSGSRHLDRQNLTVPVPDGGLTMALLGIAMGCIGAMSRRLRK